MDVGYGGEVVEWLKTVLSLSLSHAEQNLDNYHSPTDYFRYIPIKIIEQTKINRQI